MKSNIFQFQAQRAERSCIVSAVPSTAIYSGGNFAKLAQVLEAQVFGTWQFRSWIAECLGGDLFKCTRVRGSYEDNLEISFIFEFAQIGERALDCFGAALGLALLQDSVLISRPMPRLAMPTPCLLVQFKRAITNREVVRFHEVLRGLPAPFTTLPDGHSAELVYIGIKKPFVKWLTAVRKALLPLKFVEEMTISESKARLIEAKSYASTCENFATRRRGIRNPHSPSYPSDLFQRLFSVVARPFAAALRSQGWRFDPEVFQGKFSLPKEYFKLAQESLSQHE